MSNAKASILVRFIVGVLIFIIGFEVLKIKSNIWGWLVLGFINSIVGHFIQKYIIDKY